MMIDNAISEVYKEDKKVFIPDFGAIIYSEFNDSIDFNPHLNFDDGKIISKIQKQDSLSEEEAKESLEEYVEELKANLETKGTHLIGGIGYLNKGEDGTLTIATSISEHVFVDEEVSDSAGTEETKKEEESKNSDDLVLEEEDNLLDETIDENSQITIEQEGDSDVEKIISKEEPSDDNGQEIKEELIEEENHDPSETLEEENPEESIEPDYSYEADGDEYHSEIEEESGEKSRKPLLIAVGIILLLAVMAVPAYFFMTKADQPANIVKANVMSEMPPKVEQENNEPEQEAAIKNEHESNESVEKEASTSQNEVPSSSESTINTNIANTTENKTYSLILGSFKVENNADNFERHMNDKGIEVNKFRRTNSFYFVGIEHILGKTNAVELLTKLRKEEEPTAWIIRRL